LIKFYIPVVESPRHREQRHIWYGFGVCGTEGLSELLAFAQRIISGCYQDVDWAKVTKDPRLSPTEVKDDTKSMGRCTRGDRAVRTSDVRSRPGDPGKIPELNEFFGAILQGPCRGEFGFTRRITKKEVVCVD